MSRKNIRVVVSGYIGLLPAGGVTWDYIQYPLGLCELGCDVLYLEDTQQWPIYQHNSGDISCDLNVAYLAAAMQHFGLQERWSYRDAVTERYFGMCAKDVRRFCASADIFINVSCATPLREEYAAIPVRALIDTDPMFTQVQNATGKTLYGKQSSIPAMVAGHTHLFTFGENIGQSGCEVPSTERLWQHTRQPVALRYWPQAPLPAVGAYTTVFNWTAAKEFEFEGRSWGQKDVEFMRILNLPLKTPRASYCIGVGQTTGEPFPAEVARCAGWQVLDAHSIASDIDSYQNFIYGSRAEFSVAKHTYVQAKTGWFSCRSACYLAAGRPVVAQDTGWSKIIPNGCGLYAFSDLETAAAAIEQIEHAPEQNAHAARSIAVDVFDSHKVLTQLLAQMGAY